MANPNQQNVMPPLQSPYTYYKYPHPSQYNLVASHANMPGNYYRNNTNVSQNNTSSNDFREKILTLCLKNISCSSIIGIIALFMIFFFTIILVTAYIVLGAHQHDMNHHYYSPPHKEGEYKALYRPLESYELVNQLNDSPPLPTIQPIPNKDLKRTAPNNIQKQINQDSDSLLKHDFNNVKDHIITYIHRDMLNQTDLGNCTGWLFKKISTTMYDSNSKSDIIVEKYQCGVSLNPLFHLDQKTQNYIKTNIINNPESHVCCCDFLFYEEEQQSCYGLDIESTENNRNVIGKIGFDCFIEYIDQSNMILSINFGYIQPKRFFPGKKIQWHNSKYQNEHQSNFVNINECFLTYIPKKNLKN